MEKNLEEITTKILRVGGLGENWQPKKKCEKAGSFFLLFFF